MKTREQVVGMPEIVAMRREVQAAYARLADLQKRQWGQSGTPGASSETIRQTTRDIEDAAAEHRALSKAYEARVVAEMAGGQVHAVIAKLLERASMGGWGEWNELLEWAGIVFCPYSFMSAAAEQLHLALEKAGVRIDGVMPGPVRFRAPIGASA